MAKKKGFRGMLKPETVVNMMEKFRNAVNDAEKNIDNIHVAISNKDSKCGPLVWHVSLMPYVDCCKCAMNGMCPYYCYDARLVNFRKESLAMRAKNSAIHKLDKKRFWKEVETLVSMNYVQALRVNVGGDIDENDFPYIVKLSKKVEIILFTECHDIAIEYDSAHKLNLKRIHLMLSAGTEKLNVNSDLPACYIDDGTENSYIPEKAVRCTGNCSRCFFEHSGCFGLKRNSSMVLDAH